MGENAIDRGKILSERKKVKKKKKKTFGKKYIMNTREKQNSGWWGLPVENNDVMYWKEITKQ